jgi:hypothetical protein
MLERCETKDADTASPAEGHIRTVVADLLAFLGVLIFVGGLTLLADRVGQLSVRIVFSGAIGLVVGCVAAWRRLRRPKPRRWLSGQAVYRGRRVVVVSAWGVEGQPLPAIEPSAVADGEAPATPDRAAGPHPGKEAR